MLSAGGTAKGSSRLVCVQSHGDLSGIVQPGRGLGAGLMADQAVSGTLQKLAGFSVVPGTLNVRLPRPLERVGPCWRYVAAAEITADWETRTGQAGYFLAPVTCARSVAERFRGLAFQAVESGEFGYPSDQIELFCEVHLGLGDGDAIAVWLSDG